MRSWMIAVLFFFFPLFSFAKFLPPVVANQGMVVSEQYLASQVGANILAQGGNAIDAAVATGYALAVVDPCCGNIGGGGFMLIHLRSGKNFALNFRETAPEKIKPSLFFRHGKKTAASLEGYLSVGVPGTVMGFNEALKKYGSMPLKKVIQPAIDLAKSGYIVSATNQEQFQRLSKAVRTQKNIAKIYLNHGKPYHIGDLLKQPALAKTLSGIRDYGTSYFYNGPVAHSIVKASQQHGGVFTMHDFKNYRVLWQKPLICQYRGRKVVSQPPPSSGVTICEILKVVNHYKFPENGFHAARITHHNVEAMRYAFADRNFYLGDPLFIKNPVEKLLSPAHINAIIKRIKINKAGDSKDIKIPSTKPHEKMQTTHFDVVDKAGNAVAVTYTINGFFGAKRIAGDTGFFLNNELDDFSLKAGSSNQFQLVQGSANLIAPGKRPLSSMSPTMVFDHDHLVMLLGAAGGPTIITQIVEVIENVVDFKMNVQAAVNQTRYHMQWLPDTIFYEPFAFTLDTMHLLGRMGYHMAQGIFGRSDTWGQTAAIIIDPATRTYYGANDARRPAGAAVGVSDHHLKHQLGGDQFQ